MPAHPTAQNPVLLIHGLDDTSAKFYRLRPYLRDRGWPVHCIDLKPSSGAVGIDVLAHQVSEYVRQTFGPEQPIDLVGYSMGGLVSRYYLQHLGGLGRAQRLVTVASPHNGTLTAYLRPNVGASQMRRGSPFLAHLNQSVSQLNQLCVTSIWTPLDLMIVPPQSSRLPVGRQVNVPVALHHWMVEDPLALRAIAMALREPTTPHLPSQK
ncbi:MAG: lipase family alpha/beta hydrolase [Elainellaceae cyanobacterium]